MNVKFQFSAKYVDGKTDGEPDIHRVMTLDLDLLYIKQSHM